MNKESNNLEAPFAIDARSCTLSGDEMLLKGGVRYSVPIYQRAYGWTEDEIHRLLQDLLNAYLGKLGRAKKEPMFIGTMQIAASEDLDDSKSEYKHQHDIIDGQQRLTTLVLTLRALELLSEDSHEFPQGWLQTSVGEGIQQDYLEYALAADIETLEHENSSDLLNQYLLNIWQIYNTLKDTTELHCASEYSAFTDYLVKNVYFVVIETRAGLSKTLQIFDSINTAGMDLNGGDVFKIRYYEYLSTLKGQPEEVFGKIANLYTKIDQLNKDREVRVTDIPNLLDLLKHQVVNSLELGYGARELAGSTFFDRFFDTALNVQRWEGLPHDKCVAISLPVEQLDELIDARYRWHDMEKDLSPEATAMDTFIRWGRYGRYHDALIILFLHRFNPTQKQLDTYIVAAGKLTFIYSVRSQKQTYEGRNHIHEMIKRMGKARELETVESIVLYIKELCLSEHATIKSCLENDWIAAIPKSKNLLCRLDAMLDELEHSQHDRLSLGNRLFWKTEIDIEHIEAANHADGVIRADVQEEWGQDLHGLGNLIVLERSLNRSINNNCYVGIKRQAYLQQKDFFTVSRFAKEHTTWNLKLAKKRKFSLSKKLTDYLCGQAPV